MEENLIELIKDTDKRKLMTKETLKIIKKIKKEKKKEGEFYEK